ncbi:MAG: ECF transporter S component [Aerococcus sp.]|nr:ECF transporter S component [Aerococcus sp.]
MKQLTRLSLLIAVNVVIALFVLIPIPATHGNINLCDAGIVLASCLYGRRSGALVGALSGLLLDLISGYAAYMLFSLVIHGLEGVVVGYWRTHAHSKRDRLLLFVLGGIIVVGGYFLADSFLYGLAAGTVGVATNMVQYGVGGTLGVLLYHRLQRYPQVQ